MEREEARQIIATWLVSSKGAKGQRGYIEGWFDEEDVEAFRMAIEALSADTVAIIQTGQTYGRSAYIKELAEVVRCKDCRHKVHCYETVAHTRLHDGFKEHWSEPIEWCSNGERKEE